MKIIIPCAGRNLRHYPDSKNCPKILLPYKDRRMIDFIIDSIKAEVTDPHLIFVINSRLGSMIQQYMIEHYPDSTAMFAYQEQPLGFGHAVLQARPLVLPEEPILIHPSDCTVSTWKMTSHSWMGVRVGKSSSAVEERGGYIQKIIESPKLFFTGVCFIRESHLLFDHLCDLYEEGYRTHGEFQLTDGLQRLVDAGEPIRLWKHEKE